MRLRIGLLCARFTLFDPQMPPEFPARMREAAAGYHAWLQQRFETVYPGLVESSVDAEQAGKLLASERLDLLVIAPTMAVPPGLLQPAISATSAPVLLWNCLNRDALGTHLTQAQATEQTTTVGCVMISNALQRSGRRAVVVTTVADDAESFRRLERTATALATAGSLRGRNLLRLGAPIDGYTDVESSEMDLERLGLRECVVSHAELAAAMRDKLAADRDQRLAAALAHLADAYAVLGGTVNCHSDLLRWNPEVGITACLGVARLTESGRPFSCTGDQPAAIALYLMRCIAGAALYCEAYAPEPSSGSLLLVAGGEADPAWCAEGQQVRIVPS